MLLLILIIIIGIIIFCEWKYNQDGWNDWDISRIITIPLLVIDVITIIVLFVSLTECRVIDQKIKLYEDQNKQIEQKIEVTVKQYMDFESNTYKDLKTDSYINLVNMYPELKSDKLVQQQIDLYTKNNENIISLKEQKIDESIYKWWIYFGG